MTILFNWLWKYTSKSFFKCNLHVVNDLYREKTSNANFSLFCQKNRILWPFSKITPKGAKIDRLVKYLSIHKNLGHNVHRKTKDGNLGWILIFSGHANSLMKMPIYIISKTQKDPEFSWTIFTQNENLKKMSHLNMSISPI